MMVVELRSLAPAPKLRARPNSYATTDYSSASYARQSHRTSARMSQHGPSAPLGTGKTMEGQGWG
jgi:hypothetical protein